MTMLDHALAYAARGWPVFPCHPATKQPLVKSDIEGEGGVKLASTDEATVRAWWKQWPNAMIGLPTGRAIGAFVVDVDAGEDKQTGEIFDAAALQMNLETAIGGQLPPTRFATTPRGGVHLYFKMPVEDLIGNRTNLLGKGSRIDIRGEGGYVIAPPSVRKDGVAYAWGGDDLVATPPPALVDLVLRRGEFDERTPAEGSGIGARAAAKVKRPDDSPGGGSIAAGDAAVRKYGLSALDAELQTLRGAREGGRNDALNVAALKLAQLVAAGALNEAFVRAALEDAAASIGLIKDDGLRAVRATIASGFRKGLSQPRELDEIRRQAADRERRPRNAGGRVSSSPPEADPSDPLLSSAAPPDPLGVEKSEGQTLANQKVKTEDLDRAMKECADLDHSDTDNGKRLIQYFGDDLLVRRESGTAVGTWLGWAGTHWDIDNGSALAAIFAQLVGDIIMEEARFIEATKAERVAIENGRVARAALKAITEPEKADAAEMFDLKRRVIEGDTARGSHSKRRTSRRKHGLATKNRARMSAMLDCAGPHLRRSPDDFNSDPLLVATSTHTLRFVQEADLECPDPDVTRLKWICQALAEHRRSDLLTGVVPVKYNKDADCPRWRANLERFQPNEAQRRTVQQFAGLGLLAKPIQRVMFHYGTGGNFKSVFLETITRVLGDSFAIGLPTESLVGGADGSPGGARPDLERVFGKRMLRIAELPAGVNLKADLIKKLTGGEKWPVRTLYKGFFEFVPLAKTHMSGNDAPQFDGSDGGMRRRLLYIEWPVKIPEAEQRDFDIVVGELLEEASGILNWLIEGAVDYLENGLTVSDETRANTEDYFDEMDPTAMFIRDCVSDAPGESVGARVMYHAYKAHCDANARRPIFETKFGRIMKKKFKRDDKRTHRYLDVVLHDVPEARPADSGGDPRGQGNVNRDVEI